MRTGYIGLGNMGKPIAERLASDCPIIAYDTNEDVRNSITHKHLIFTNSLRDVAQVCEVVFLCLPSSKQVKEVIFGLDGILSSESLPRIIVDQSTGDPRITRSMASALSARGISLIDGPVSGGPRRAREGTLIQILGGPKSIIDKLLPLLSRISNNIFHVGDVGSGHVAKIANNMISHSQRLLTLEVISFAEKSGVCPILMGEIMAAGSARNYYIENYFKTRVLKNNFEPSFTLDLLIKDVGLAVELAASEAVPMPISNSVKQIYEIARGALDHGVQADEVSVFIDKISKTNVVGASLKNKVKVNRD